MAEAGDAWTDIPLCVLVGSKSESVLRQTLASALVRRAHELGVDLQVFIVEKLEKLKKLEELEKLEKLKKRERLQYKNVKKKLPIIESVKTTLRGYHTKVQWETLKSRMLVAFHSTEVYDLIDAVEQTWDSAEQTVACDELVFCLLQDVIKDIQHDYCELIDVTSQNSRTNAISDQLHSIRLIRNDIVHKAPHTFSGHNHDRGEFLTDYKETMTHCVCDIQCYPLRCEERIPNLLELKSTFDVYTEIIEVYKREVKNSRGEVRKNLYREWKQLRDKAKRAADAKINIKEFADRMIDVTSEGMQGGPEEMREALGEAHNIALEIDRETERIPDSEGQG